MQRGLFLLNESVNRGLPFNRQSIEPVDDNLPWSLELGSECCADHRESESPGLCWLLRYLAISSPPLKAYVDGLGP